MGVPLWTLLKLVQAMVDTYVTSPSRALCLSGKAVPTDNVDTPSLLAGLVVDAARS